MKLIIIGANDRTGTELIDLALARGQRPQGDVFRAVAIMLLAVERSSHKREIVGLAA